MTSPSNLVYRAPIGMIFIQFEAMPTQDVAARDNVAGAYVNCWIQANDAVQAEARGRQWISDQGWIVVSVKQYRTVDVDAETSGARLRVHTGGLEGGRFDCLSSMVAGQ